jgi:hypothetical protein
VNFGEIFDNERAALKAARRAYIRYRKTEYRFRDENNWGTREAIDRMRDVADDLAEEDNRASALLFRVWDVLSRNMPPIKEHHPAGRIFRISCADFARRTGVDLRRNIGR